MWVLFDFQADEPRICVSDGRFLLFFLSVTERRAEEGGPWLLIFCFAKVQCIELLELMNYPSKLKDWGGRRNVNTKFLLLQQQGE